jgi:hypothetical protein
MLNPIELHQLFTTRFISELGMFILDSNVVLQVSKRDYLFRDVFYQKCI